MPETILNPAKEAAKEAHNQIRKCIDEGKSFLVEAGAGSGKTYSLIEALKYLINERGTGLIRKYQQVACITYTNTAVKEIETRIDKHPAIIPSTIHSFCWSIIAGFQIYLKEELKKIEKWKEKFAEEEIDEIDKFKVEYKDPARREIKGDCITIWHDDVLELTVHLLEKEKFRTILANKFPIILIDEYQDCDERIANALKSNILQPGGKLLIGFFGDSWQKIYDNVCGEIKDANLEVIKLKSNFRSVPVIVDFLNNMRTELPQKVSNPEEDGIVAVYHSNDWSGSRKTGQHWEGDLPDPDAHKGLEVLKMHLMDEGWDFSPEKTKILMLTHMVLSKEQGYEDLAGIFPNNDSFVKKENPHIKFFADILEPACKAYLKRKYGEMFDIIGTRTPKITKHADKIGWTADFDKLIQLRSEATIGEVLDHLRKTKRPYLPEEVEHRERELEKIIETPLVEEPIYIEQLRKLRNISYQDIIRVTEFIENNTPFSTKHGVKGTESENVLVVFGRGWNKYNWNEYLEWVSTGIPTGKESKYERNRNLFYVSCSRAKKRLALFFTQKLSDTALATLSGWFKTENIYSLRF
jgi:DNA helicase II / ATP-dependent DNA helicase PcrA